MTDEELYQHSEKFAALRRQENIAQIAGTLYGASISALEGNDQLPGKTEPIQWSINTANRIYDAAGRIEAFSCPNP